MDLKINNFLEKRTPYEKHKFLLFQVIDLLTSVACKMFSP